MRAWLRSRPVVGDVTLAILLVGLAAAVPQDAPTGATADSVQAWALVLTSCAATVFRRRWPYPVLALTLAIAVLAMVTQEGAAGALLPLLVALYTAATRSTTPVALGAALMCAGSLVVAFGVAEHDGWRSNTSYALIAWMLLAAAIGIAVRNQRRAVSEAWERARVAEESREQEAQRRVNEERLRIARDLHDVVAHHISVVAVQAGVAEHLLASDPAFAKEAIGTVRRSSAEALEEMSTVLGLLRGDSDGQPREPARGLDALDDLVESVRAGGLGVAVSESGARVQLAPLVDVTAYRLVEEALTNALRHGSGAAEVSIQYGPSTVLEVRNPVRSAETVGEGHGLVGMRERVTAVGGMVTAGPDGRGQFVVHAELPTVVPILGREQL